MDLKDKVSLITGGTRGIGAAAALALAERGSDVAIVGRQRDREVESVVARIALTGRRCLLVKADLRQPEEAARCVEETVQRLGRLDALVHSAGGPANGGLLEVAESVWYDAFDIHVHAAFHLCRAAVPPMRRHGEGAIVLISSAAGLRGCKNAAAYGVVKGAILQMTRVFARELADDNIRVNCIAPGVIRTRFQDYLTPEQVANNIENRIPLHREGRPEEVAEVIALL
ncbi:MAG TPA: SDR family NAD(P)-dependent oxidoreductase, partial [Chthonomonadaceae bacterium]|nr:SDR family NAD(P)-dependent oxidoreductase [Chthonomonadaceae bacterium]